MQLPIHAWHQRVFRQFTVEDQAYVGDYIPKLCYLIIYPCPNSNWTMTVKGGPLRQHEGD